MSSNFQQRPFDQSTNRYSTDDRATRSDVYQAGSHLQISENAARLSRTSVPAPRSILEQDRLSPSSSRFQWRSVRYDGRPAAGLPPGMSGQPHAVRQSQRKTQDSDKEVVRPEMTASMNDLRFSSTGAVQSHKQAQARTTISKEVATTDGHTRVSQAQAVSLHGRGLACSSDRALRRTTQRLQQAANVQHARPGQRAMPVEPQLYEQDGRSMQKAYSPETKVRTIMAKGPPERITEKEVLDTGRQAQAMLISSNVAGGQENPNLGSNHIRFSA